MRWRWNRLGRELFRAHELAAIEAIRGAVDSRAAEVLARQIDATMFVSRYIDDTYVDLYPQRRRDPRRDWPARFPNRSLDLRLATVMLRGPLGAGTASTVAVDGNLFELVFSPSPKKLGKPDAIVTTGVKLHADPMQVATADSGHPDLLLLELSLRAELDGIWRRRPAWATSVMDPNEVYLVDVDGTTYLVLAQLPDTTYVAGRIDPPVPGVVRFEPEGDHVGQYATLTEAISSMDGAQP